MRLSLNLAAVAVGTAFIASACGSTASPSASHPGTTSKSGTQSTASASSASAAPKQLTPISIEIPAQAAPYAYLFVARDMGLFQKYGLSAKLVTMSPPTAIAGILNGQLTFMATIGSAARGAEKGQPLKVVDVAEDSPTFVLVGAKGITKVSQLKNQVISAAAAQETITQMVGAILSKQGIPAGDYKLLDTGDSPSAQEGVLAYNHAAAAMFDLENGLQLEPKGYKILDSTIGQFQFPFNGLATSTKEIQNHPNVVREALQAVTAATEICDSNEAETTSVMEKDFHLAPSLAQQVYQQFKPIWVPGGVPPAQAITTGFQFDQAALNLKTLPKASAIYDFSLLPGGGKSPS